jgi:phosphatidylinositol glycan class V
LEKSSSLSNVLIASVSFSLGSALRSNGIVSCGFVVHLLLKKFISEYFTQITSSNLKSMWKPAVFALILTVLKLGISILIIVLPFVAFQYYGYTLYCQPSKGRQNELSNPPWCSWYLPLSYSYIQNHYWSVGFLKYFETKQIPNFLLALPMIILCSLAVVEFISNSSNSLTVRTLGLWQTTNKKSSTEAKQ